MKRVAVSIDLSDHDFLRTWKPTRAKETFSLGQFKGADAPRYTKRPTVASVLGRWLYKDVDLSGSDGRGDESVVHGVDMSGDAPGGCKVFVEIRAWDATKDDDGETEVTIWTVTDEEWAQAVSEAGR